VQVKHIVGAIANEAGLDGRYIRNVTIYEKYSTLDLPEGMPRDIYRALKKVWIVDRQLNITRLDENNEKINKPKRSRPKKKKTVSRQRSPNAVKQKRTNKRKAKSSSQ